MEDGLVFGTLCLALFRRVVLRYYSSHRGRCPIGADLHFEDFHLQLDGPRKSEGVFVFLVLSSDSRPDLAQRVRISVLECLLISQHYGSHARIPLNRTDSRRLPFRCRNRRGLHGRRRRRLVHCRQFSVDLAQIPLCFTCVWSTLRARLECSSRRSQCVLISRIEGLPIFLNRRLKRPLDPLILNTRLDV